MPFFIITMGLTGTGKGSIHKRILELKNKKYKKILIDDLIEKDKAYKKKVSKAFREICRQMGPNYDIGEHIKQNKQIAYSCINKILNDDEIYLEMLKSKMSDGYFRSRRFKRSVHQGKSFDNVNNANLELAISQNKNIIFETTGGYFPSWIFSKIHIHRQKNSEPYKLYILCTSSELKTLAERNIKRAKDMFNKFIDLYGTNNSENKYKHINPRLPHIKMDSLIEPAKSFISTFITTISLYNALQNLFFIDSVKLLLFNNTTFSEDDITEDSNTTVDDLVYFIHNNNIGEYVSILPKKDDSNTDFFTSENVITNKNKEEENQIDEQYTKYFSDNKYDVNQEYKIRQTIGDIFNFNNVQKTLNGGNITFKYIYNTIMGNKTNINKKKKKQKQTKTYTNKKYNNKSKSKNRTKIKQN